jgi:cation diffusion facilitator family transporter
MDSFVPGHAGGGHGPDQAGGAVHLHVYEERGALAEQRMRLTVLLTAGAMLAEIITGWRAHSMALLTDGWHMGTHVLALGAASVAYALSRRLARDARFAFGTWKIEVLAAYTSALGLAAVALCMLYESAVHLLHPVAIGFAAALPVAVIGLLVNLLCTVLLGGAAHEDSAAHGSGAVLGGAVAHRDVPGGGEEHAAAHRHGHGHHDLNLRSAYVHVAADCATSLLAILALLAARFLGLVRLDGLVGIIGALVVALWALGLLRDASRALLDAEMDSPLSGRIRAAVGAGPVPASIRDLHIWRVSRNRFACLLSVATEQAASAEQFHRALAGDPQLAHLTVEVRSAAVDTSARRSG